jgi:SapC protein
MVTASLPLFYQNVVALDRRAHARLKLKPPQDYLFTADAALIPLLTGEFSQVCREYPIVFIRETNTSEVIPVALTGMPQGKNLFLDSAGRWDARYVPAYVRRYPFVYVETSPESFTVCIDPTSKCLDESEGVPLFGDDGEPSGALKDAIKVLSDYQNMIRLTRAFMSRLAAANILMDANAKADLPDGRSLLWQGFQIVEEARFRQLPEATLKEWFSSGELGLLYAHLFSLGNLSELLRRQTQGTVERIKSL